MTVHTGGDDGIAPGCQERRAADSLVVGAAAEGVEQYDGLHPLLPVVDADDEKFLNDVVRFVVEMKLMASMLVSMEARLKRLELRLEALEEV